MRSIDEIYKEYTIMPLLEVHQRRVKAVGEFICDHFKEPVDKESVSLACAFHDMGNIIKFDLTYFPDAIKPEGLEYWEGVKREFIEKYGTNEHEATITIAKEIGLSEKVIEAMNGIGFSHLDETEKSSSMEKKICAYSDMRVGVFGILTIDERLADGRERYKNRKHSLQSGKFDILSEALRNIEKEIFNKTDISPEDVNNESTR